MDEAPRKLLSLSEWESMYERMVSMAGVTAKTLNSFDQISHKAQVYGEAMPLLVDALIDIAQIKPTDVFFDIGSGIGNIVLQIAAQTGCKAYGIEIREDLHQLAEGLLEQFNKEYESRNVTPPEVKLIGGDALSDSFEIDQYYVSSTIVFMNNWCFPPSLERGLCLKFEAMLQKDVKLIALKNLFPREEPWKQRYRDSPVQIFKMPWERYKFPEGCISWAHRPITAYIYNVDREFDFEKKVAFFEAQLKKNKNYKGRTTHTVQFDEENGKIDVKEVDETEEKQKKPKENKLPKVNDFVDLVTSSRDSASSSGSVKVSKPRAQPSANGAPPKRKFRRRGKTPFLTDRDGDDYICLTCKAKDRMPWRFKMSQQIAAHVRLHQFNPYKFDDDEEGEEDDEVSVSNTNTNQHVPLIDLANEKSVTKNGADEFAALISLMSIAQSEASAMQIDSTPAEPIIEQIPIVNNNENVHIEKDNEKELEKPVVNTSSKRPGELNMRSRLTDSLTIDPVEIQRTRERLAEKEREKEAAKANGEVSKPPKKLKISAGNSGQKGGTEEKKKSGEKSTPNGLKTSKDRPKKIVVVPPNDVPKSPPQVTSPDPRGKYIVLDGQAFEVLPNGELQSVSMRRATAHEPKSKKIIDNFPELPSERRPRKGLTKSKNDNTATSETNKQDEGNNGDETSTQQVSTTEQTHVTSEKNVQPAAQSELPLINPELHSALKERFNSSINGELLPGPDFHGVPPAVMQHYSAHSSTPFQPINGLKHAHQPQESQVKPNETAKSVDVVKSPSNQRPTPINGVKPKRPQPPSNLVDSLPVVKSSNPDAVTKRVNELTKSDESWRTKRPQETEQQPALPNTEAPVDHMDIVRDELASETSPTIASVEQAAQAMDVTPSTDVTDRLPGDIVGANSAGEHYSEAVLDRAVDELPTAEITASPAHVSTRPEVAQEASSQTRHVEVNVREEERTIVEDGVVIAAQREAPEAVVHKPEEVSVPELIVTPAVVEPQPIHVPASSEEISASERESVKDEQSKSTSNKKRKRAASTTEKTDAANQNDNNTDANTTPQSAQPKPKKRRFESELSGLFHGQINYDYKIEKEFLYSTKRSCVVKKVTPVVAPKTPSRPMTSSPLPRARSRKAGANDPALKTPPVSPIKFDLKEDEEHSTSAKPKPKKKSTVNTNNNNNTNKTPDPEPISTHENKPKSSPTKEPKKPAEKPIEKTATAAAPEEPTVNTNKAPARPRSKSKSKPKDLAESILAKVSNLTPIKNANKHLPKPKLPSKSKRPTGSRSESPSTSTPSSPSKHAPLVRNASTAAALLLLAEAEKELMETTVVPALHSTNALIAEALSDNEQIALSAVMATDMEIIDNAQQDQAAIHKPVERQVVDISGQVPEPARMIDIATEADDQAAPVNTEVITTAVHVDLAHIPEHRGSVNGESVPIEQRVDIVQESQRSNSLEHSIAAAEVEPMSDQSVDQTMNDSANDKLLNEAIEAHVISRQVVPEAASTRPSTASADPAPVTNMSLQQSIAYLKNKGLIEPVGTVDVLPDNEQSSFFATMANYQDVDDDDEEDDDILLLPTDS